MERESNDQRTRRCSGSAKTALSLPLTSALGHTEDAARKTSITLTVPDGESMKTALVISVVLFIIAIGNSHAEENSPSHIVHDVSLIQLIAAPDNYHGKVVRVRGFLSLEFEGDALYLHREDFEKMLTKNGIALITADSKLIKKFNKKYVLVEGLFCKIDEARYAWPWTGLIKNIRRVETGKDGWTPDDPDISKTGDGGNTCP